MTTTKTLAEQIVTAIKKIAETNHYLVGLNVALVSTNDLDDAEQILITEENAKRLKRADICFIVIHEAKKQLAAKNAVAAPVLQRKATAETKRLEYRKATAKETKRLKYLHGELRAERISYGDLVELQQLLATVIAPDDVELLEAAGVPEHDDAPVLLDPFTTAYIEAMLWSSRDDDDDPMDAHYSVDDIAPEFLAEIVTDCAAFQDKFGERIDACAPIRSATHSIRVMAGHDYWLTRAGHAGFWDGDWPEVFGDEMTEYCHARRCEGPCVGDGGKIYSF